MFCCTQNPTKSEKTSRVIANDVFSTTTTPPPVRPNQPLDLASFSDNRNLTSIASHQPNNGVDLAKGELNNNTPLTRRQQNTHPFFSPLFLKDQSTTETASIPITMMATAQLLSFTPLAEIPSIVAKARAVANTQVLHSVKKRKEVLKDLIDFFTVNEKNVAEILRHDLGRHSHESYVVETSQIIAELTTAFSNVETWAKPDKVKTGMNTLHMLDGLSIRPEPLGLVCVIAPWNYPFAMCFSPIAGAIAAGNVVVLKPSELAEGTAKFIAEELPKYKSLGEFIHVINGGKDEVTELLNHKFDHIFYTGNGFVGRIVMGAAAKHLTPVTLELGGKSPVILDESCASTIEYAAKRIMWGKFVNCGQTCVAPDYVLVPKKLEKAFLASLEKARDEFFGLTAADKSKAVEAAAALHDSQQSSTPAAYPLTEALQKCDSYGRIVNDRHWTRLVDLIANDTTSNSEKKGDGDASENAFAIAFGGERDAKTKFLAPTVVTQVGSPDKARMMRDEIFGPILPVIPYETVNDAILFVNSRDKPLALYIFSNSKSFNEEVLSRTSSGGVTINDVMMHVGTTFVPFGGVGESGMGRYHGKYSFDTFSHHRSVLHKGINGLGEKINGNSRYPPYTASMTNLVKKVL